MLTYSLPSLIVPKDEQEKQLWAEKILRYVSFATMFGFNYKDQRRYNYRIGNIDSSEFNHVTNLYCDNEKEGTVLPAHIRQINPIDAMVLRQVGSMLTQPFTFTTKVNDESSIEEKLDEHIEDAKAKVGRVLRQVAGVHKMINTPLQEGDDLPINPEEVFAMNFDNAKVEWEEIYQSLLDLFTNEPDINFKQKFFHSAAEQLLTYNKVIFERYYDEVSEIPNFRNIDSRCFWGIPSANSPLVEDYVLAADVQFLTLQEILQRNPNLTPDEVAELEKIQNMFFGGLLNGWWSQNINSGGGGKYDDWFNSYYQGNLQNRIFRIKVTRCYWRANVENSYGVLNDKNIEGDKLVIKGGDKKVKDEEGESVQKRYDEEVWQGEIYGYALCSNMIPMVHQPIHKDAPYKRKLPVCGIIDYRPSFVDNLIDLQCLRIQLFHKLELISNQISGNILVIDKAAGGDVLKNLYNLGAYRIMEINTAEEGAAINPNAGNNIKTMNMDLSNSFVQLLQLLGYIDNQMALMSGQNDAAQGQLKDYASNGLAQQQLQQSQLVNLPRIDNFFSCGERLLQSMCDLIPSVWHGRKIMKYYLSASDQRKLLNLELPKNMLDFPNMAVNVAFSASDMVLKNEIIGGAMQLLATTTEPEIMNAIFKMKLAPTAKMAQKMFEEAVMKVNAERAKQQEMEQQNAAANRDAMMQARVAPAQVTAQAAVEGKKIQQQTELQKTQMKNQHEGTMSDVEKQNEMDKMVAANELAKTQGAAA